MTRYDFVERATASIASNKRASQVRRELYSHLVMKEADLVAEGKSANEARDLAIAGMGDPALVADGYAAPRTSPLRVAGVLLAGVPLVAAGVLTANSPPYIMVLVLALLTVAVFYAPGDTLPERLQELAETFREGRLLALLGGIAGLAAAIAPGMNALFFLFEIAAPWLGVLYISWQRNRLAPRLTPYAMTWIVAGSASITGGVIYALANAGRLPWWQWVDDFHAVAAMTGLLLPISVMALGTGWNAVLWLRRRYVRLKVLREPEAVAD